MEPLSTVTAAVTLALAPLFTDHMVLQRGQENPIWGTDAPQSEIRIEVEGSGPELNIVTKCDENGHWMAELPELPTGGPYTITVASPDGENVLDDVLVGEVWLVSGQSNMEFELEKADDAKLEIATACNKNIRHFKVEKQALEEASDSVNGTWEVTDPSTAGSFSAIGYFFGREINSRLDNVPVGIINSTWGGTCVEAWTSVPVISRYVLPEEIHPTPEYLARQEELYNDYLKVATAWRLQHMPQDPGNEGLGKGWADADFDDSGWELMKLPAYWQGKGLNFNGVVWFRKEISVPAEWAGEDLTVSLGNIDDYDNTYFDGTQIGVTPRGSPDAYSVMRVYTIPAAMVHNGRAVLCIRVFDDYGNGGFGGNPSDMWIAPAGGDEAARVSLAGDWRYMVEHNIGTVPVDVFKGSPGAPGVVMTQNRPGFLFNGMINALIPYGIRGVLWYQGEQNENNWETYGERIRAMIRDWRSRWGEGDFPFYYVQLACFNSLADWAELRNQQDYALMEPDTGRALTIDIGEADDIHPRNKQEAAHRLALVALSETYGFTGFETSGPVFQSMLVNGGEVTVRFGHDKRLNTAGNAPTVLGFELAGEDGVYHPATASIVNNAVVVRSSDVPAPVNVRYAWASAPAVNLVNDTGLPAAPFSTSVGADK